MPRYIERFKSQGEKKEEKQIDYSQEGLANLEIKEPVVVKGEEAFMKARKIKTKEIKAEGRVFTYAEDCQAERVETRWSAFTGARHCQVEVVNAAIHAFWGAENCQVKEVETGSDAFIYAKDCRAGVVESRMDAFQKAEGCWAGEVKAKERAFPFAKTCQVERVEAGKNAFKEAERCLITEKVKAGEIGPGSLGVVVLGKTEGEASPSVILMKGKLERERPEEIRRFFEEELKKSQKGEESIYDYLSFFNWEGKSLKEGKEKLKRRYERVKEKRYLLEELKDYNFFFLIGDNSKREEIVFDYERLEEHKKALFLLSLNHHLPQLEKIKDYFSILSLDDWVKLGEYAEFLDFDEEKLKGIKDPRLIREALLNSPKENLRSYLRGLGIELKKDEEIDKDTFIAATVHKLLGEKKGKLLVKKRGKKKPREFDVKLKR